MVMGKAAVFVEPYHFEITELPPVPVESGGIRVKVSSAGICGSDLHFWRGELKPIAPGKPGLSYLAMNLLVLWQLWLVIFPLTLLGGL